MSSHDRLLFQATEVTLVLGDYDRDQQMVHKLVVSRIDNNLYVVIGTRTFDPLRKPNIQWAEKKFEDKNEATNATEHEKWKLSSAKNIFYSAVGRAPRATETRAIARVMDVLFGFVDGEPTNRN